MNNRSQIQKQHEHAVVNNFLAYYNRINDSRFVVDAEPEPPEAIAKAGDNYIWIEATGAYWSDEYARDLQSYANPVEKHVPVRPRIFTDMDEQLAERFVQVQKRKRSKSSYKPFFETYGSGILLISMQCPFFNEQTRNSMRSYQDAANWDDDLGYFGAVYIADGPNSELWLLL